MITYAQFLLGFPEFSDFDAYPKTQIDFWIGESVNQLSQTRFGARLDYATMLFVAHNIVLSKRDQKAAGAGAVPGEAIGPTASKGVGPVNIGYDSAASAIPGAGAWNLTRYGQQLYKLIRIAGAGGAYVGNPQAGRFMPIWPLR